MCLSAKQQRELDRCEAAYLREPERKEPLFDSLEDCIAERCGVDCDCDDCIVKACLCRNWQDETNEQDLMADDYAQKEGE